MSLPWLFVKLLMPKGGGGGGVWRLVSLPSACAVKNVCFSAHGLAGGMPKWRQ